MPRYVTFAVAYNPPEAGRSAYSFVLPDAGQRRKAQVVKAQHTERKQRQRKKNRELDADDRSEYRVFRIQPPHRFLLASPARVTAVSPTSRTSR
jgi:hypothetical protein